MVFCIKLLDTFHCPKLLTNQGWLTNFVAELHICIMVCFEVCLQVYIFYVCLSLCKSVRLCASVCLSVCNCFNLSVCMSVFKFVRLSVFNFVCLSSFCWSIHLSVRVLMPVNQSVCLSFFRLIVRPPVRLSV